MVETTRKTVQVATMDTISLKGKKVGALEAVSTKATMRVKCNY